MVLGLTEAKQNIKLKKSVHHAVLMIETSHLCTPWKILDVTTPSMYDGALL